MASQVIQSSLATVSVLSPSHNGMVLQKVSDEGAEVGHVGDGMQCRKDVKVGDEPEIVEQLLKGQPRPDMAGHVVFHTSTGAAASLWCTLLAHGQR